MVDQYYDSTNISQSQLKLLLVNPSLFNTIREPESFYEEKRHFIIGSAVDCLLTTPEDFEEKYHISQIESKPSDVIKNILHRVLEDIKKMGFTSQEHRELSDWRGSILDAVRLENYYSNLSNTVRVDKIVVHQEYFDDLIESEGKQVLSVDEKTIIDSIVMSLTSNEITRPYIVNHGCGPIRYHYQMPIYWVYKDVSCKALLDIVIVDHNKKTVQPIDIKTLGDYTNNFPKSLRKRRYDIQAAFYTQALKDRYPDWTILPFIFVVESTIQPGSPLVYKCDETLLNIGKFGRQELFIEDNNGVIYKIKDKLLGFDNLIDLYKYHSEVGFQNTKEVNDGKGELLIDWEGIL